MATKKSENENPAIKEAEVRDEQMLEAQPKAGELTPDTSPHREPDEKDVVTPKGEGKLIAEIDELKETVPGGRYIVGGVTVNAHGEEIK